MNWEKLLFGDLARTVTRRDGKEKISIAFEGGVLPALLVLGGIAWLIAWFMTKG
ncbi:hypothetical protein [Streptococcus halichoeri]|uniref:hypothetical protein n=1 Tax=Streptococcus halichoeri TaxID=254785 RepID=UPI00135CD481|nr:hypothetical protein [Streptococcus halichoeri]